MLIDISKFEIDEELGHDLNVLLIIKGFHQREIVTKIIERRGNRSMGLTHLSDISKRKYSDGFVVSIGLQSKSLDNKDLEKANFKIECKEPFGVDINGEWLAIASGSEVILRNLRFGTTKVVKSKWMSFLHSVEFSEDGNRLLVSSAGYDTIMEFDQSLNEICWEWNTWDNGFHYSQQTKSYITRNDNTYLYLSSLYAKEDIILVNSSRKWADEGIPTPQSPTRLNGASYGKNNEILATCYHRPELFIISRDFRFQQYNLELTHPHSFKQINFTDRNEYWVADSGRGRLVILDTKFNITSIYDFSKITANARTKHDFGEWIQSVSIVRSDKETIFIAVDALRVGVHLIDPINFKRRFIGTPSSWTIQGVYFDQQMNSFI